MLLPLNGEVEVQFSKIIQPPDAISIFDFPARLGVPLTNTSHSPIQKSNCRACALPIQGYALMVARLTTSLNRESVRMLSNSLCVSNSLKLAYPSCSALSKL